MPGHRSSECSGLKRVNLAEHEQECGKEDEPNKEVDVVEGGEDSEVNFII